MYHIFYLFRVSRHNVTRFVEIVTAAGTIYKKDSTLMRITETSPGYGGQELARIIAPQASEELFLGIDSFQDAQLR